jgi:hypothetical protein
MWIREYCPNCKRMTTFDTTVTDEIFDNAIECINCHVVFEAVAPSPEEPTTRIPLRIESWDRPVGPIRFQSIGERWEQLDLLFPPRFQSFEDFVKKWVL